MDDSALLASFVGPSWERHYRDSFARRAAGQWFKFNGAAFLFPLWLAWRGMWAFQFIALVVFDALAFYLAALTNDDQGWWMAAAAAYLAVGAVEGFIGDWLVHGRARRSIEKARARGLDQEQSHTWLRQRGGVSGVGVVLVPAVIVLLVAIAIPKFFGHGDPYRANMRRDLRNLVTAEESYFADSLTYSPHPASDTGWASFPSPGVTITLGVVTPAGWNATATSSGTSRTCGIFVGAAPSPVRGAKEGEPECR